MFPQIKITHNIGNTIEVPNQLDIRASTYSSDNTNAGSTTTPVENALDFSSGSILTLLSSMGSENAEIVTTTTHTNTSLTTVATLFSHTRGEVIHQLNFDQILISKSATINGTYTPLITQSFQVKQQRTIIFDPTGLTTDFYKVQWRNSLTGNVSAFSVPISVATYPANSVASIIYPVLSAMGVSKDDPKINTEFLLSATDDARKFTAATLYGIRQAWQQKFEHPIKLLAGTNFVYLPDDIEFLETDQSVLAARFLIDNILTPYNLRYIDKRTWNQVAFSVMGGEPLADITIGAGTIVLDNTGDFWDSGVAYVACTDFVGQTIMEIQYTGNNKDTNTLTGVTGVTRNIPAGTRIWTRPTISQPIYYTVYDGKLVFDRIIPDSMNGFNVYIDYYAKIDDVTSLAQILPERYREMYKWYLRYAIKYRKDLSLPSDDPDLVKFEGLVKALFNNLYTGQDTAIIQS